jgi:hypothetical protein
MKLQKRIGPINGHSLMRHRDECRLTAVTDVTPHEACTRRIFSNESLNARSHALRFALQMTKLFPRKHCGACVWAMIMRPSGRWL